MKVPVKLPAYEEILQKAGLPDSAVAFVGDDLPDLPVMHAWVWRSLSATRPPTSKKSRTTPRAPSPATARFAKPSS